MRFGHRLRALDLAQDRVAGLDFGDEQIALGAGDGVILAVPPVVAGDLVPDLTVPREFRAIVNAHFRVEPPAGLAPMTGIINGTSEWLFAFPGRLAVTISAADRLLEVARETLAQTIWAEVASVAALPKPLPPWQIVRERRATFAATPARKCEAPCCRNGVAQSGAGRRLDQHRFARNHRGGDPLRQSGGRSHRCIEMGDVHERCVCRAGAAAVGCRAQHCGGKRGAAGSTAG